jgi:cobalt-zinc-cadmium efflux system outer membrane protein
MSAPRRNKLARRLPLVVAPGLLWLAGCATPPLSPEAVQRAVAARTDLAVAWPQTAAERAAVDDAVRDLLARDLTPEAAARIAVLNSHALRATFAGLGVAQAELLAAGRLANPTLGASVRWPDRAPRGPNVELSLAGDLLDSLLLPVRQKVARERLAQAESHVAHAVLALAAEAQSAAYTVQGRQQILAALATIAEVNAAAADLAQRQFDAGNITRLTLLGHQSAAATARLELARAEAQLRSDRENMSRLLGLTAAQLRWKMADDLPPPPASDPAVAGLEAFARSRRLDLAAAQSEVALATGALDLKRRTRLSPVTVGVDTERDASGGRLTGPRVEIGLPIFDQGQADLARLAAELHRAEDARDALAAQIGSEVRAAADAVRAAREAYGLLAGTLLPQRQAILRETLLAYNAMQRDSHELLAAKEREQATARETAETLLGYWLARIELVRALGGSLPPESAPAITTETSK